MLSAEFFLHHSGLILAGELEPVVGLEPTTDGLQNRCSTTELNWPRQLNSKSKMKNAKWASRV